MLSIQLKECLLKDEKTKDIFIGIFARDELPEELKYPCCFILNTDPSSKSGEHWLALYFKKNGYCDFFDSYGFHPSVFGLESYLDKVSTGWDWNKKRIQGISSLCGYYALLYLLFRARNRQNTFFNSFSKFYSKNDKLIFDLIKEFNF